MQTNNVLWGSFPVLLTTCLSLTWLFGVLSQSQDGNFLYQVGLSFTNFSSSNTWTLQGSADPCALSWVGVYCNKNRVIQIQLASAGLGGTLNTDVLQLTYLQTVDLSYNKLGSFIPAFGSYDAGGAQLTANLSTLDLRNNYFTGTIPESLQNLTNLLQLNLSYNNLSGSIPSGLIPKFRCDSFIGNPLLNISSCYPGHQWTTKKSGLALSAGAIAGLVVGCVCGGAGLVLLGLYLYRCTRAPPPDPKVEALLEIQSSLTNAAMGHMNRYTYEDLVKATQNFASKALIGEGATGRVYKGRLDGMDVAIKRLKVDGKLFGSEEFVNELYCMGRAVHRNVLRVMGVWAGPEGCFVLMPLFVKGSVAQHLQGGGKSTAAVPPLDWPTRKKIALGTAEGLAYLHGPCMPPIIHRDVKAANVLLNEQFEPVLADFGLAKNLEMLRAQGGTVLLGTRGYMAPEYVESGVVSEKTDVYAFGMFLLELVAGRNLHYLLAVSDQERSGTPLRKWVMHLLQTDQLSRSLVDPALHDGTCSPMEVVRFVRIALLCTDDSPSMRPTMSDCLFQLRERHHGEDGGSFEQSGDLESGSLRGLPKRQGSNHHGKLDLDSSSVADSSQAANDDSYASSSFLTAPPAAPR